MTDPISHLSRMAQMDSTVRQAAKAEKRQSPAVGLAGGSGSPAAAKAPSDEVQLSELARKSSAEPQFDSAKVDAIKRAIQQGQYPIDARRIAEHFVALERMIQG